MKITFFEGQKAFLEDYQKVVKDRNLNEEAVIEDVMAQLNEAPDDEKIEYKIPAAKTTTGKVVKFPFSKEMVAEDIDPAISTRYFYEGEPFEVEDKTDEQP